MILQGLKINMQDLDDVFDREFEGRQVVEHERLRRIAEHDIVTTRMRFSSCKCEGRGLYHGMTVEQLIRLGAGCTDPLWVCPRLVALRRMYGH